MKQGRMKDRAAGLVVLVHRVVFLVVMLVEVVEMVPNGVGL